MSIADSWKLARPALIKRRHAATPSDRHNHLRLLPAAVFSAMIHVGFFGLLVLVVTPSDGRSVTEEVQENLVQVADTGNREEDPPAISIQDIDPDALDPHDPIAFDTPRQGPVSVSGQMNINEEIGTADGKDDPLRDIPEAKGSGGGRGALQLGGNDANIGTLNGDDGGIGGRAGKLMPGGPYGRSGVTKKKALLDGGTTESEAAVARGIDWIVQHQARDGHWSLDGFHQAKQCNCENRGSHNSDIAGTAFGLLPLLGAGHTHEEGSHRKTVLSGLNYLVRKQNKRTGDFGDGMYAHGLAATALCEAYALTQDPVLKRSAQLAVNYIVYAQHREGGWRYGPKQKGDTSVAGWQIMALKSAQMANLEVPARSMKKAEDYLNGCMSDVDQGYGYYGKGSTPTMSAVGLLCRQYLQGWGPSSPRMVKGVNAWLMPYLPAGGKNMYFYYYAAQVLHHLGGENWEKWNVRMRDILIKEQDQGRTPRRAHQKGSWSPVGDPHGEVGGRLMITSLSILTLEVYYRHLPLYRRAMADGDLKAAAEPKPMKRSK